jgi:hypothetical protein
MYANTLAGASTRASAFTRSLVDALNAARSFTDPNLSPAGISAARAEKEAIIRQGATAELEAITTDLTNSRDQLLRYAAEASRIPDDAAALIRAEQRWRQVERILEAGGNLSEQIRVADHDTARAIAEFAPGYLAAKATAQRPATLADAYERTVTGATVDHGAAIRPAVYARLAQTSAVPEERELMAAAATAVTNHGTAAPWLSAASEIAAGGSANILDAAVGAQIAAGRSPQSRLEDLEAGDGPSSGEPVAHAPALSA